MSDLLTVDEIFCRAAIRTKEPLVSVVGDDRISAIGASRAAHINMLNSGPSHQAMLVMWLIELSVL